MEYEYAQILYKYLEKFKLEYKSSKKRYREMAYYFNIDIYRLRLEDNKYAEVKCNSNRCKIILNSNLNNSNNLILIVCLIPVVLLYRETNEKEFSDIIIYDKENLIKYSNIYKMFAYDILFDQNNLYNFINESRGNNVQKK